MMERKVGKGLLDFYNNLELVLLLIVTEQFGEQVELNDGKIVAVLRPTE